jgi:hypothetical protein
MFAFVCSVLIGGAAMYCAYDSFKMHHPYTGVIFLIIGVSTLVSGIEDNFMKRQDNEED